MLLSRFRSQSKLLLCNELFDTQSSCLKNKPRCFHRFRYKNEHGSTASLLLLVATHHIKNTLYFCDLSRFTKSAQLWEVRKSRLRSIYIKVGYSSVITSEYSMEVIKGVRRKQIFGINKQFQPFALIFFTNTNQLSDS